MLLISIASFVSLQSSLRQHTIAYLWKVTVSKRA